MFPKYSFSILLSLVLSLGYTQEYYPLFSNDKNWQEQTLVPAEICQYSSGSLYFSKRDSLVQDVNYSIIEAHPIVSLSDVPEYCPPYAIDTSQIFYSGLLREDVSEKKVYILIENEEYLLYDFTLEAGESFSSQYATDGQELRIESIEALILMNGQEVRRFHLSNGQYYTEGLGGSQGLLGPMITSLGFSTAVQCIEDSDDKLYGDQCFDFISISNELNEPPFQLWIDPVAHEVRINSEAGNHRLIQVFNLNGQLIQSGTIMHRRMALDLSIHSEFVLINISNTHTFPVWIP
jgi:hypothetical protein